MSDGYTNEMTPFAVAMGLRLTAAGYPDATITVTAFGVQVDDAPDAVIDAAYEACRHLLPPETQAACDGN